MADHVLVAVLLECVQKIFDTYTDRVPAPPPPLNSLGVEAPLINLQSIECVHTVKATPDVSSEDTSPTFSTNPPLR